MSAEPVVFDQLTPAAEHGWHLLLDLSEVPFTEWLLIGGQMMHLLTIEHSSQMPRPTDDMDVAVNVRARQGGIGWLSEWLVNKGLEFLRPSTDGIGTRFACAADPGPGRVVFDVLAPDGLGERTDIRTLPPARTVEAPGVTQAFARSEWVPVSIISQVGRSPRTGQVRRPTLLAALITKAANTRIPGRTNSDRDWADAALTLTMLDDPIEQRGLLTKKDRQRLRYLTPLLNTHDAWAPLGRTARQQGQEALAILLDG